MQISRRVFATCAALYFLSQILFLVNIQFPRGYNFDEFHYVPAAKQVIAFQETRNWEHPPLAKQIMAAGIAVAGDRPIGWRLMSTIFGSLTLVGMYFLGLALFKRESTALWIAALTAVNQLLYVQARIGMLDTFMFGFIVWALVAFARSWDPALSPSQLRRTILTSGVLFALGSACKWAALVPWALCWGVVVVVRQLHEWKVRFENPAEDDWYDPRLWQGVPLVQWLLLFGLIPAVVYFLPFVPLLYTYTPHKGFLDLFAMQKQMWEGQLRVVNSHPYMSHWTDWAILKRPIWYAFDREGDHQEWVRGVVLLGNPLIMWTGLIAVVVAAWSWIQERGRTAFLITFFFAAFYLPWVIIPRKVSFYYYYYPAGMMLSLALAYFFERWRVAVAKDAQKNVDWVQWSFFGVALGVFIFFFPILAALRIQASSFTRWMWLTSWI